MSSAGNKVSCCSEIDSEEIKTEYSKIVIFFFLHLCRSMQIKGYALTPYFFIIQTFFSDILKFVSFKY